MTIVTSAITPPTSDKQKIIAAHSASDLNRQQECGRRYQKDRENAAVETRSFALERGTAFHEVLANALKESRRRKCGIDAPGAVAHHFDANPSLIRKFAPEQRHAVRGAILDGLWNAKAFLENEGLEHRWIEQALKTPAIPLLGADGGIDPNLMVRLSARLDYTGFNSDEETAATLEIVDWKTSTTLPSEAELLDLPSTTVSVLLAHRFLVPNEPCVQGGAIAITWFSVTANDFVRVVPNPEDLTRGRKAIRQLVRERASASFAPQLNTWCDYCNWRGDCDLYLAASIQEPF